MHISGERKKRFSQADKSTCKTSIFSLEGNTGNIWRCVFFSSSVLPLYYLYLDILLHIVTRAIKEQQQGQTFLTKTLTLSLELICLWSLHSSIPQSHCNCKSLVRQFLHDYCISVTSDITAQLLSLQRFYKYKVL